MKPLGAGWPRFRESIVGFCIATAQRPDAAVLTNDVEYESVESLIKIRWLTK